MTVKARGHLADLIQEFLQEFAGRDAQDPQEYSSPDAAELDRFARQLRTDAPPKTIAPPFSDWGSGGFKPYTSKRGRWIHDGLVKICEAVRHD